MAPTAPTNPPAPPDPSDDRVRDPWGLRRPPAIARVARWLIAGEIAYAAAFFTVAGWSLATGFDLHWSIDLVLVIGPQAAFGLASWLIIRRRLRQAAAADFQACIHCVYDLRGGPETGICPECGQPYERSRARLRWLQAR